MPKISTALFIFAAGVAPVAYVMFRRVGFVEATIAPRPETAQSQGQWLVFATIAVGAAIMGSAL